MTAGTFALPLVGLSPSTAVGMSAAGRRSGLRQFIGGSENRLVETVVRSATSPLQTPFNPLVFCGPSGTGKSHVALGLARAWKASFPQANVVYRVATDLCRGLNGSSDDEPGLGEKGLGNAASACRRPAHRMADYLVIDNLDSITQSAAVQHELSDTLDAVINRGGRVVLTALVDPAGNQKLSARLRSRLAAGLVVPISPPGLQARARILRELATAHGIALSASCVRLLAEGATGSTAATRRTVPELLGVLVQLEFEARSVGQTIDEALVVAFLAREPAASPITVDAIVLAVARHFHVPVEELRSKSRKRTLVLARGVAVYLARKHTSTSFVALGRFFGGRDHTTAMHAHRKIADDLDADATLASAVRQLEILLDVSMKNRGGETLSPECQPLGAASL